MKAGLNFQAHCSLKYIVRKTQRDSKDEAREAQSEFNTQQIKDILL